jgi:hypothetical protein
MADEMAMCAGILPPIVATGAQARGIWVEFGDWPAVNALPRQPAEPQSPVGRLRPLIWFQFFDKAESCLAKLLLWHWCRGGQATLNNDVPVRCLSSHPANASFHVQAIFHAFPIRSKQFSCVRSLGSAATRGVAESPE